MRASILLVGLVGYVQGNNIYNTTAAVVQQQPYELSNIAAESVDIDSQQLDIFIDTQSQPVQPQSEQSYKQGYQQTIEVSSSNEFTNEELIIYQQILLEGYTNTLLSNIDNAETEVSNAEVSNEEDEISIKIIEQELTTLYGANSTSKNLITLSFILSNGQSNAYEEHMNTNLTDMTSKLQTANLPIIQVFDITRSDELDYNLDSIISTNSPTEQPTNEPTEQSTLVPTKAPVTPSPTDSLSTPFPTVSADNSDNLPASLNEKLSYVVDSKMVLYSTSSSQAADDSTNNEVVLSDEQKSNWEEVTRDYIRKSIQSTIGSSEGSEEGELDVTVSLNTYRVLSPSVSGDGEVEQSNLRRRLQQQVSDVDTVVPLELDFTTNIQLSKQSQEDYGKTLNGNELVASAFRSVQSQNEYITLLKDSNTEEEDTDDLMKNVQSITLEVDNKLVTESSTQEEEEEDKTVVFEEVEAETQSVSNEEMNERDMLMYIIIAVLGATFLCSITVCCCCSSKKSKEKKEKEGNKSKSLAESDSMAAVGGYDIEQHQQDTSSEDGSTKYDTAGSQSSQSESSQAAVYHSISIKAPSGKLGLVLVNNVTNDLAGITRIKEDSILSNQVNVGDLLLSVDEVDCRGMMACDVSELIGSRCENDERVLVLLREA